jgi:hypothetical protein
MGDGIKICGEGVLEDGALDWGFASGFGPELVGGIAVGGTARGLA